MRKDTWQLIGIIIAVIMSAYNAISEALKPTLKELVTGSGMMLVIPEPKAKQ